MKRRKIAALLLALCLLPPAALACGQPPSSGVDDVESVSPDSPSTDDGEITSPTLPEESTPTAPEESAPTPPPVTTPVLPAKAQYVRATGSSVNLRAGAGTDFTVIGRAEKNTSYAVLEKSGGWYKTYYRGKTAYISASYGAVFSLEKTDSAVEEVIAEGYKLIGVPYVYGAVRFHDGKGNLLGGFTAQKFDCSSLVQYVFYKGAGKLLDVTTRTQVKQGAFVAREDLRRGDCIYFTNEDRQYKTGVERIGHVAIYLGDNYILHTAIDYARIEKMSAKRWSFYVEARRFV